MLLDLRLSHAGESDGLALCRQLSEQCPDSRVLVLTTFVEEWLVLEAIKQGAKGYLAKDIEPNELVSAIRAVPMDGKGNVKTIVGEGLFEFGTTGMEA